MVVTRVPSGVSRNSHSWVPVMPCAVPVQTTRDPCRSARMCDVTVKPSLVQVNDPPGRKDRESRCAAVMCGCQVGHRFTLVKSFQTVVLGASMSMKWCDSTGAEVSGPAGCRSVAAEAGTAAPSPSQFEADAIRSIWRR